MPNKWELLKDIEAYDLFQALSCAINEGQYTELMDTMYEELKSELTKRGVDWWARFPEDEEDDYEESDYNDFNPEPLCQKCGAKI
jgi:hypothetical protein